MNNKFIQTFLLLIISTLLFLVLKTFIPKTIFEQNEVVSENIIQDSLMLAILEEEKMIKNIKDSLETIIKDSLAIENDYSSKLMMNNFYAKLLNLKQGKKENIRIAYFGDSMNDGDLIVQDIRKLFQTNYGGKGVGFVNIFSESARSRGSIIHNLSDNWNYYTFLKASSDFPFGVGGCVALANDTTGSETWVEFGASFVPQTSYLYQPTLFYGKADSGSTISIEIDGLNTIDLNGQKTLNTLKLSTASLSKLKIYFETNNTPLYGINFDNNIGVHVDNFSSRGNSGLPLSLLRGNLMSQFQKKLGYDLIILQFGTNIISKSRDYDWYSKAMKRVVKHLKNVFPEVNILVLSVADKSRKYNTEMKTDSAIYSILKVQREYAKSSDLSFISLYELMGGENSMIEWVENEPIRANKDYTHFNVLGSKEIAQRIFNEIDSGFIKYEKTILSIKIDSINVNENNEDSID